MDKIELDLDMYKDTDDNYNTGKIVKYLSVDKTKIPLTNEEYNFIRKKIDEHIEEHGISFGFVYNMFLKVDNKE